MTGFVVGDNLLLLWRHQPAAPFWAAHADTFDRLLQLAHADGALVAPRRQDGRLVDHILQVGADKTGRLACDHVQVDVRLDGLALDVHVEDGARGR